jgi:uncharacterized protein
MVEHSFRKAEVEGSTPSIGFVGFDEKYNSLKEILRSFDRVIVAYSGGVDSTMLLKASVDVLGAENVLAFISVGSSLPESQRLAAVTRAEKMGVKIREITTGEMGDAGFVSNKADRCFHCKSYLYRVLKEKAREEGIEYVLCGSNLDDEDDYRPGNRAQKLFGVRAPLAEAKLTKNDIREISGRLGLSTAQMPASPCLASRIPYGQKITEENLKQVEEAEDFLKELGFVEFRVRHHGNLARIEVKRDEIQKISSEPVRGKVINKLKSLGFNYVTIDMEGFRSGSLNEALSEEEKAENI